MINYLLEQQNVLGFQRRMLNTGEDYLDFEARYTVDAVSMFKATAGTEQEVWRNLVLKQRKEARDLWLAADGYIDENICFGEVE